MPRVFDWTNHEVLRCHVVCFVAKQHLHCVRQPVNRAPAERTLGRDIHESLLPLGDRVLDAGCPPSVSLLCMRPWAVRAACLVLDETLTDAGEVRLQVGVAQLTHGTPLVHAGVQLVQGPHGLLVLFLQPVVLPAHLEEVVLVLGSLVFYLELAALALGEPLVGTLVSLLLLARAGEVLHFVVLLIRQRILLLDLLIRLGYL